MILFEYKFPTEKNCKSLIIEQIKDSLSAMKGKPVIDEHDLNLILDEAIINAMEHGNRWNPEKEIMIKVCLQGSSAEVIIGDEGEGFEHPGEQHAVCNVRDLGIRGRGIHLIQNLSNSEWLNNGNTLKINIPLNIISYS